MNAALQNLYIDLTCDHDDDSDDESTVWTAHLHFTQPFGRSHISCIVGDITPKPSPKFRWKFLGMIRGKPKVKVWTQNSASVLMTIAKHALRDQIGAQCAYEDTIYPLFPTQPVAVFACFCKKPPQECSSTKTELVPKPCFSVVRILEFPCWALKNPTRTIALNSSLTVLRDWHTQMTVRFAALMQSSVMTYIHPTRAGPWLVFRLSRLLILFLPGALVQILDPKQPPSIHTTFCIWMLSTLAQQTLAHTH